MRINMGSQGSYSQHRAARPQSGSIKLAALPQQVGSTGKGWTIEAPLGRDCSLQHHDPGLTARLNAVAAGRG